MIYGIVQGTNGERIAYASVSSTNKRSIGAYTNQNGEFSLKIPMRDSVKLLTSYIGYKEVSKWFCATANKDIKYNHVLRIEATEIPKVEVVSNIEQEENVTYLTSEKATALTGVSLSGIEGSIKTFAGVSSKSELSSNYSVRGGSYDENLVYINDIPAFKPKMASSDRQEGLSIINPYMVEGLYFSSGGFGVQYGDKMSSVLAVKYKDVTKTEAQLDLSLMDANLTVGSALGKQKKFSFLIGTRYKNTSLLLNSLEETGEYRPKFYDIQSLIQYKFNNKLQLSYWFYGANNDFNFTPHDRTTTYGSEAARFEMYVAFEGNEEYKYQNMGNALTLKYNPSSRTSTNTSILYYNAQEEENFDVLSQYRLGELLTSNNGNAENDSAKVIAIGSFLTHGRNSLNNNSAQILHNGKHLFNSFTLGWGAQLESSDYDAGFNEWVFIDSANYSLPYSDTAITLSSPKNSRVAHTRQLAAAYLYLSKRFTWEANRKHTLKLSIGNRITYDSYTNDALNNPRFRALYKPESKRQIGISFSAGIYYQPPEFKELINDKGILHQSLPAQKSTHFVLGYSSYEMIWKRPFKLSAELYYKNLKNNIPYVVDNVNNIYFPELTANGYIVGLDAKINGEFVPGVESWASISFMQAREHLQKESTWIRKPNDQLINFNVYFQDYVPGSKRFKVNLTLLLGSKLPYAAPQSSYEEFDDYTLSPYVRFDLGATYILLGEENTKQSFKHIQNMWLGAEVFNVLDSGNRVSYFWITDVNGQNYAVPNYLTSRRLNLKLSIKFKWT